MTEEKESLGDKASSFLRLSPTTNAKLLLVLLCAAAVLYGVWGMAPLAGYFATRGYRRVVGRVLGVVIFTLTQIAMGGAFLGLARVYTALEGPLPPLAAEYSDWYQSEEGVSSQYYVLAAVAFVALQIYKAGPGDNEIFAEFMEALVTATLAVTQCGQWLHRIQD